MPLTLPSAGVEEGHLADGPSDSPEPGDDLGRLVARWGAEDRVDAAAAARARERWLQEQASDGATLVGLLLDLAEGPTPVAVTAGATRHTGVLVGVGADFCVVAEAGVGRTLIALAAVTSVTPTRPGPAGMAPAPVDDRRPAVELQLAEALTILASDRSPVRLRIHGDHAIVGTLLSVGANVASVRLDGAERRVTHVPLAAVESCTAL